MNVWLKLSILSICISGACVLSKAESRSPVQYDMYSWKDGNDWSYSLLAASKERKADVEIKKIGGPLRGSGKVKEKLLNMKEGDSVFWKERSERGMIYPPAPIIQDIKEYAQTVGVRVLFQGKPPQE